MHKQLEVAEKAYQTETGQTGNTKDDLGNGPGNQIQDISNVEVDHTGAVPTKADEETTHEAYNTAPASP